MPPRRLAGAARLATDLLSAPGVRRSWVLRLTRPANLFQPHNDTSPDRYPEIFGVLRRDIGDGPDVRLLSFGCSTGDEVLSLRGYFPQATITGIDISRGNIRDCRRRQRRLGDTRMRFTRAGTAAGEPADHFDAVVCMAVLRHGDLGAAPPPRCDHLITFAAFRDTTADLARCVRPGGYLVIEHSNFRFGDTDVAAGFDVVHRRPPPPGSERTPLYGPDNRRLTTGQYPDVVFRKRPSR